LSGGEAATRPARRAERQPPLARGDRVSRYEVLELIGAGGMGAVYAARDPELDRKVAIKVLYLAEDRSTRRAERLIDEGRALARLTHPNVVAVFDVGRHKGSVFIAMELVKGPTLDDWLAARSMAWRRRVELFVEAGRGLAAVHACGIVHLDFKPSNVMVDSDGRARLADFGLAAGDFDTNPSEFSESEPHSEPTSIDMSRARGTPRFMAPEQQSAGKVTAAADQFAFCVALYESLAGRHPFGHAQSTKERMSSIAFGDPKPLEVPGLPPRIAQAIMRGLSRLPADRWPSLSELLDEIEGGARPTTKSGKRAVVISSVVVLGALTWAVADRGEAVTACPTAEVKAAEVLSKSDALALSEHVSAFESVHGPLPVGLSPALERRIDDWSEAWVLACEAVRAASKAGEAEASRVLDCLTAQQVGLEGTAALLLDADTATLVRGLGIVNALDQPAACTDPGHRPAAAPPPAGQRSAIAQVRVELQRARLQQRTGRTKEAIATAEAAVESAEAVGYAPLTAEAMGTAGGMLAGNGIGSRAEPMLERAAWLFLEAGDHAKAAQMFVALVRAGRPVDRLDETLAWADRARAILEEHPDPGIESSLEVGIVFALWNVGRMAEAVEHGQRAVELLGPGVGDAGDMARAKQGLAVALMGSGRLDEAEAAVREAIRLHSQIVGPRHPTTGSSQQLLAAILNDRGRLEESLLLHDELVESFLLANGADSRITAGIYNNRGNTYMRLERYADAIADFEHAAEVWDRLGNFDSSVYAYVGLAETKLNLGDLEGAKRDATQAWELITATPSGEHSLRWEAAALLAKNAKATGDAGKAVEWWSAALEAKPPTALDRAEVHAALVGVSEDAQSKKLHRIAAAEQLEAALPAPDHEQARVVEIRAVLDGGQSN